MNSVILTGRLTRDPRTSYSQGAEQTAITRFTLAVNRRFAKEGEPAADFIECVCFKNQAEHASRYYKQGTKIEVRGRIQTGSYINRDGQKVYTTEVVIDEMDFAESKAAADQSRSQAPQAPEPQAAQTPAPAPQMTPKQARETGQFMAIPDEVEDFGLPFN